VRFSINRFADYLRITGQFDISGEPEIYQSVLDEYLQWMRERQHAATGTIDMRRHSLRLFLQRLGPEATAEKLSRLTAERVEEFFLEYAKKTGLSARRTMQAALRTFFRFCLHRGYIYRPLDHAVPTLRTYKLATVPRGLTEEQARKVLACINRNSDAGRRDYAICQLLYTYGVRGGQVRALRLEDIDWEHDRILFRASKQGKDSLLPLTAAAGKSVLNYLRNARPPCTCREVFLTALAPYRPLPHSCTLSAIVGRHIRSADIEICGKGGHAFRHGFATRMLAQDHSLKEIADVLGHRHLATTSIYAKVDFKALKPVGLEWPLEVQS
jgi:site-specific recombinase XerD